MVNLSTYQYQNWFERFKDRHFPLWLKQLWPIRYSESIERFHDVAAEHYEMIDNGDGTYTHNFTFIGKQADELLTTVAECDKL